MADVKWIKLSVDVFSNRKIKQLRGLPDGDAIIGIWIQILCLAGKTNNGGAIYFSTEVPYTEEMLAIEFDRPINLIRLAMATFEIFGMLETIDNVYLISNWEKYQSADKLEQLKEQNRLRVKKYREKQKQLATNTDMKHYSNVTGNDNVMQCNGIDKEKDIDKDINNNNNISNQPIILTELEAQFIQTLESIQGYPIDRVKDVKYMKLMQERYPTLDLMQAIQKWAIYIMDNPFKKNANHRSQMNTSFGKYVEWGNCLKGSSVAKKATVNRVGVPDYILQQDEKYHTKNVNTYTAAETDAEIEVQLERIRKLEERISEK